MFLFVLSCFTCSTFAKVGVMGISASFWWQPLPLPVSQPASFNLTPRSNCGCPVPGLQQSPMSWSLSASSLPPTIQLEPVTYNQIASWAQASLSLSQGLGPFPASLPEISLHFCCWHPQIRGQFLLKDPELQCKLWPMGYRELSFLETLPNSFFPLFLLTLLT